MKIALTIIGAFLILIGGVWFLQGINILPGSLMSGQVRWAINGGLAILVGIVLVLFTNRHRFFPPKK